jgi:hypothetical protein
VRLRLAKMQVSVILEVIEGDAAFEPWLEADQVSKWRYDWEMPAVGWLRVFERLERATLTPHGRNSSKQPMYWVRARNNIRRALNHREVHPAMTGKGVIGIDGLVLPAWPTGDRWWSPYPVDGATMVALVPHTNEPPLQSVQITWWEPESPGVDRGRLFDEAAHRALAELHS